MAEVATYEPLTRPQLTAHVRARVAAHVVDDSGMEAGAYAIYALADPRDVRAVRYIGQTASPARRFLQHLNTARLWLPDDVPWWFKPPRLRPLYDWIRELHRDEYRLPVMVIGAWVPNAAEARGAERARIFECLREKAPLLNFETEVLGRQMTLI